MKTQTSGRDGLRITITGRWYIDDTHWVMQRAAVARFIRPGRNNGTDADNLAGGVKGSIPEDGKYTWIKGAVKDDRVYGVKIKQGFMKFAKYEYEVRYDAGPGDLAWFEEKDRNYLTRILKEGELRKQEPAVWYYWGAETAQKPNLADWWSQKLKLPNIDAMLKKAEADELQLRKTGGEPAWEKADREAQEAQEEQAERERQKKELKKAEEERLRRAQEIELEKLCIEKLREESLAQERAKEPSPIKRQPEPLAATASPSRGTAGGLIDETGGIHISLNIAWKDLTLGRELGRGGFGVVYQGEWKFSEAAIKQLLVPKLSGPALEEFRQEATIMARMRSPNIVPLYGVCLEESHYAMVMEYLPKGSLFEILQSSQTLDWPVRHQIGLDVGCGLAFLHSEKILHRDLKSPNVLLGEGMRAKLCDFGLAKVRSEVASTTKAETSAGTLLWMAPELFSFPPTRTDKTDVYALAVVLWELASRQLPFQSAEGNTSLVKEWVKEGAREPIPEDTPPGIAKLIGRCWAQRAEDRPTAAEAVKELRQVNVSASSSSSSSSSTSEGMLFSMQGNLASKR